MVLWITENVFLVAEDDENVFDLDYYMLCVYVDAKIQATSGQELTLKLKLVYTSDQELTLKLSLLTWMILACPPEVFSGAR
jgi:hypothetical protein